MRSLLIPRVAARVATLLVALVAAPALSQPTDADFLAARDAFRAGDSARLDGVAPRLRGHLLEPYVAYWQIALKLNDADSERVQAFLARYDGMPLADRLRSEWLKSLAKREQWIQFAAEYPKRVGDDAELDCYALQWKRTRDGDVVFDEAMPYWLSGQDQPESCQVLFAAMLKAGIPNIEMHIYANGAHPGQSLGNGVRMAAGLANRNIPFGTWQDRFTDWLRDLGFLQNPGVETKAARDTPQPKG